MRMQHGIAVPDFMDGALTPTESEHLLGGMTAWLTPSIEGIRNAILEPTIIVPAIPEQTAEEVRMFSMAGVEVTRAVQAGRLFDMGYVPNELIRKESRRAGDLYAAGHLGHPFREAYALFHTWEQGASVYLVKPSNGMGFIVSELFAMVTANGSRCLLQQDVGMLASITPEQYTGRVATGALIRLAMERGMPAPDEGAQIGNLVEPVLSLILLLATDGVAVTKIEPDAKLNKARVKNRKPVIPSHWRVHTGPYITALSHLGQRGDTAAKGGGHSTPRPHLRRGHLRHKSDYHGGGTVWVRDALVMMKDGAEIASTFGRTFYQQTSPQPPQPRKT